MLTHGQPADVWLNMMRRHVDPLSIWRSIAGPAAGLFIPTTISADRSRIGPWFQVYVRASDLAPVNPRVACEELIERAGSMDLVGTLALINNYLATIDLTPDAHDSLLPFLSQVRQGQLRDHVGTHPIELPDFHVVFSRMGCLAAMTLLLLARDRWPTEVVTSADLVGELVLLTNDLLKEEHALDAPTGESILLEFLTNWDISNTADIALSMARGDRLIRDHLRGDSQRIVALRDAIGLETDNFDGCSLEEHQALTFTIYSVMSRAVAQQGASSLEESSVADSVFIAPERVAMFFDAHSQDAEAFSSELAGSVGSTSLEEVLRRPELLLDTRPMRRRPFLRRDPKTHLLLDLDCLVELSAGGLYWHFQRAVRPEYSSELPTLWGYVFHDYCRALLDHFYPNSSGMLHHELSYEGENDFIPIDAVLNLHSVVILFEFKASKLRTEDIRSRDSRRVDRDLVRKFVAAESALKGAGQLARDAEAIVRGRLRHIGHHPDAYVYPVLITEEPLIASVGVNERLNEKMQSLLSADSSHRIRPLTSMWIEELEFLLPYVTRNTPSWQYLLGSRFNGNSVRSLSVYQALWDMRRREKLPRYQNEYLMSRWEELFARVIPLVKTDGLSEQAHTSDTVSRGHTPK
ncbi:MAG: hypothetical protein ACYC7A_21410 [Thermoanaerobaculia bacterium]